ncbi:MAG TPA: hypothetical protein VMY39_04035 [Planctomycetota bacterium]|nr:hypothetical protein [Planctomycetota bacterium]
MRRLLAIATVVLLLAAVSPAVAELCAKCAGLRARTDLGVCVVCGARTASRSFKLCPACSRKLGECERCRAPLAAKKTAPADATSGADRRAAVLRENIASFQLDLVYHGEQDKPFYTLTLLRVARPHTRTDVFHPQVVIDEKQVSKIIDHLVVSAFLERAAARNPTVEDERSRKPPAGPCYVLTVRCDTLTAVEDLGWGLPMLERLDALRTVLDGDAAGKMDLLLARLAGLRRAWEKAAKPDEK